MVFESAFAVAQYGRVLFLSSGDSMMVALVSPRQTSSKEEGSLPHNALSAAPTSKQTDEVKGENPADMHSEPDAAPTQLPGQITKNGDATRHDPGPTPSASGGGQGMLASAQFGIASPPEWAMLAAAIERTKVYPRLARERGIEGVVRLRFRLTSSGSVAKLEILQSSGYEILDSASIGAVYRAAPMPYVSGWVEMPMKYVLK